MGSGINSSAQGKYVGTGAAQSIKELGFQPKKMKILSVNGSAEKIEGMAQTAKRVVAGDLTYVDGLEFSEFGFDLSGSDVCLNALGVTYHYEAY